MLENGGVKSKEGGVEEEVLRKAEDARYLASILLSCK
jgi:hypothetical protein